MTIRLASSVADPYPFDTGTDPDPGCDKNSLRIRIQDELWYESGSSKKYTDPDPGKKD